METNYITKMLHTSKAEAGSIRMQQGELFYNDQYLTQEYLTEINSTSHHLYVLSNEKIEEGDVIMTEESILYRYNPRGTYNDDIDGLNTIAIQLSGDKKVIATTQRELGGPKYIRMGDDEYFCKICGQDHIERNAYATWFTPCKCKTVPVLPESVVKEYCRHNGDIGISVRDTKPVIEKTYTRDEVVKLIMKYALDVHCLVASPEQGEWIKSNLK